MSTWGESGFFIFDAYSDPRTAVIDPIMTRLQKERFAKLALGQTEAGKEAFNKVFGGPQRASPFTAPPLFSPGVPCFAWTK